MNVSFSFEKKKIVLLLVQRDNHDSSGTLSNEYERKIWYSWKSKILDQNVKVIFFIAQQKSPTDIVYLLIFEKELTKKNTQKKIYFVYSVGVGSMCYKNDWKKI